jgi:hypothetical protein
VALLKKIVHQMEYLAGRTNRQLAGVDRTESNHNADPGAGIRRSSQLAGRITWGLPYGTELLSYPSLGTDGGASVLAMSPSLIASVS